MILKSAKFNEVTCKIKYIQLDVYQMIHYTLKLISGYSAHYVIKYKGLI